MRRRNFLKNLAATSLLPFLTPITQAKEIAKTYKDQHILTGNEFFLDIDYLSVNITGNDAIATAINGQLSGKRVRQLPSM